MCQAVLGAGDERLEETVLDMVLITTPQRCWFSGRTLNKEQHKYIIMDYGNRVALREEKLSVYSVTLAGELF